MRGRAVILAAALAWFIGVDSAEANLDILVDKATQRMLVIQDGYIRYMWPVSTGRDNMATPNGIYTPQRLERNWFSSAYYDSPMPYSIFFHNGYAIHGSYAIDRLGGPASHGCVRLHPHHAQILFDLVQQEGPGRTTIEITDDGRPEERSLPGREIAGPPGSDFTAVPPREFAGAPGREFAGAPGRDFAAVPPREFAGPPGREFAGAPGRDFAAAPPREFAGVPGREFAGAPGRDFAAVPPRDIPGPAGREIGPAPGREIAAGPGENLPVPRVIRYRDGGDMPEPPPPTQRGYRPMVAKNVAPPPLRLPPTTQRPAPVARRMLVDVRSPANAARTPGGAGEANIVIGSPRPPNESSDPRSRPKVVERPKVIEGPKFAEGPKVIEAPKVIEGPSAEPARPASSTSSFKLLPASCWSGGASRWQWWSSSQGNSCK
jgi:hypothetical protein